MVARRPDPWTLLAVAAILVPLLSGAGGLSARLLGVEGVDYYGTLWFYWSVAEGTDGSLFYHPFGQPIAEHNGGNVLDAALAAPLRWLLGPVAGLNAFLLLCLLLNGLGMAALARRFTDDARALIVGSLLFAVTPYALFELSDGRPTQCLIAALPLLLLAVMRCREPGPLAPILGGILLGLIGYQYWFYAFFSVPIVIIHGLGCLREDDAGRILARHGVVLMVGALLAAPVAGPLLLSASAGEIPGLLDTAAWSLTAITPPALSDGTPIAPTLWLPLSNRIASLSSDSGGLTVQALYQPLTWTALAGVVAWWLRPGALSRGRWLGMIMVASVLAAGPILVLGGSYLVSPLYLGMLEALSPLRRLWWPGRAMAWISVLVGLAGVIALHRRPGWVVLAAAGLVSLELHRGGLSPLPTWEATIPAGYRCLAHGPPGALIELPFGFSQAHLYHQTAHGRPILGGMLEAHPALQPVEAVALRENPWLAALLATTAPGTAVGPWDPADRQSVESLGYRYVVFQKDALHLADGRSTMHSTALRTRQRRQDSALQRILGMPVYDDSRLSIWSLSGEESPCAGSEVAPDLTPGGGPRISPGAPAPPASVLPLIPDEQARFSDFGQNWADQTL